MHCWHNRTDCFCCYDVVFSGNFLNVYWRIRILLVMHAMELFLFQFLWNFQEASIFSWTLFLSKSAFVVILQKHCWKYNNQELVEDDFACKCRLQIKNMQTCTTSVPKDQFLTATLIKFTYLASGQKVRLLFHKNKQTISLYVLQSMCRMSFDSHIRGNCSCANILLAIVLYLEVHGKKLLIARSYSVIFLLSCLRICKINCRTSKWLIARSSCSSLWIGRHCSLALWSHNCQLHIGVV